MLLTSGCVEIDPATGDTKPRGGQFYEFSEVQERAEDLMVGMTTRDVILLLGSPAEKSRDRSEWVYLPERAAVLIPGRALKLEFESRRLASWGYHAIILGQRF